jgi:hypothetical protein
MGVTADGRRYQVTIASYRCSLYAKEFHDNSLAALAVELCAEGKARYSVQLVIVKSSFHKDCCIWRLYTEAFNSALKWRDF